MFSVADFQSRLVNARKQDMYFFLYKSAQNFSERTKFYNRIFQYLSALFARNQAKNSQKQTVFPQFIIFQMKKNGVFFKENLFPNASFAKEEVCFSWSYEDHIRLKYA